jgi:predicted transcriptional regulator YdeE
VLIQIAPYLLFGTPATLISGQSTAPKPQPLERISLAVPIHVVGFSVRTNNAAEANGDGEISKLWNHFFQENLGAQIPHRIGQTMIVVYSDYTSDQNGEYTYTLGAPVDSIDNLPKGLSLKTIPTGPYAVLTIPPGLPSQTIPAAWMKIWQMSEAELGGKRCFIADYELYEVLSNPNKMQMTRHLGLEVTPKQQ